MLSRQIFIIQDRLFFLKANITKIEIRATEFKGYVGGKLIDFYGDVYLQYPYIFTLDGSERSLEVEKISNVSKIYTGVSAYINIEYDNTNNNTQENTIEINKFELKYKG